MTDSPAAFGPGDDITLGTHAASPKGTLMNIVPGTNPPIWNVKMQDGSILSVYEGALTLKQKAERRE